MSLPVDEAEVLTAFLLAQSDLTGVVGDNILGPGGDLDSIRQAVTFEGAGGTPHRLKEIGECSFLFKCWGSTPVEAKEVYRALYLSLHQKTNEPVGAHVILSARMETGGQTLRDPDTPRGQNWYYVPAIYRVKIR